MYVLILFGDFINEYIILSYAEYDDIDSIIETKPLLRGTFE